VDGLAPVLNSIRPGSISEAPIGLIKKASTNESVNPKRAHDFLRLRYDDPDLLLNNAASAKVQKYREDYSVSDVNKAFPPALLIQGNSCASSVSSPTVKLFETIVHWGGARQ